MDLAGEGDRLLDFARASCVAGGFAWLDDDGVPDRSEPLRLWITARMTHVFAFGHLLGRPGCAARRRPCVGLTPEEVENAA